MKYEHDGELDSEKEVTSETENDLSDSEEGSEHDIKLTISSTYYDLGSPKQ